MRRGATIPQLVAEQAAATPTAPAVIAAEHTLDHAALAARVEGLAAALWAAGVRPESVVAVALERSAALVVALLAVQRVGAAYLPLDRDLPAERIAFMLADAEPAAVLGAAGDPLATLVVDDGGRPTAPVGDDVPLPAERDLPRDRAAYVIYTSGSTGTPKGVVVGQGAIVNRLLWMQHTYRLTAADRVLQKTPSSFDVSVWEFFWPLITGAALVVAPPGAHRDPAQLAALITRHQVSTLHFVPSMLGAFLAVPLPALPSLRRVLCSGEALTADLRDGFHARYPAQLHNLYGPTEAAVDVTATPVPRTATGPVVPIGAPVWNTQVYVLDPALAPVPRGVPGELYLAGVQLARGYLRRPGLTATRFVANPFGPGRLYRTGDVVRRLPDGALDYLGRDDDQVKIRGFRIELGEVQAALGAAPGVTGAAVVARTDAGSTRLAGYVTGAVDPDAVRRHAAAVLPEYMVPATLTVLDALPVTPNGKLDRRALPAPDPRPDRHAAGARAPRGPVEATLHAVVVELLGGPAGVDDDLFTLGADSIMAITLVGRAGLAGLALRVADVFAHPTIAGLAAVATAAAASPAEPATAAFGEVPLPPIARRLLARGGPVDRFSQATLVHLPAGLPDAAVEAGLAALLRTHDLLRARLDGTVLRVPATSDATVLTCVPGDPDWPALLAAATARLDPRAGVMLQAVRAGDRLLLVAHHLVVDAVSWRILLPELAAAVAGQELDRAPVSYRTWRRAAAEADGDTGIGAGIRTPLPGTRPLDPARDVVATAARLDLVLPAADTARLRDRVAAALPRALATALGTAVTVDVEGHGRGGDLDLSRTVGWFTEVGTVTAVPAGTPGPGRADPDPAPHVPVLVNFVGPLRRTGEPFTPAPELGELVSGADPQLALGHALEIDAYLDGDGALRARWTYATRVLAEDRVRELGAAWLAALAADTATPADFPLVDVTAADLAGFGDVADVLPPTPLQEGLAYLAALEGPDVYTVQLVLELDGPLDPAALRAAAQAVLDHNDVLRSTLRRTGAGTTVVVLARTAALPWVEADATEDEAAALLAADRLAPFDLASAPLLRATLLRLDGAADGDPVRHRLALTHHHALLDGSSDALLVAELFARYRGAAVPARRPFRDHLRLLAAQQPDLTPWTGIEEPTRLVPDTDGPLGVPTELVVPPVPAAVLDWARRHGLTPNTLVQGAWAVLLGRLTGRTDVVFGSTVSGRGPDLDGVAEMVGLFINTQPVPVRLDPGARPAAFLAGLQAQQAQLLAQQHVGLARIQRAIGLTDLFDTLVVFESYPRTTVDAGPGLTVRGGIPRDATHYPVTLIAAPDGTLVVKYQSGRVDAGLAHTLADGLTAVLAAFAADVPLRDIDPVPVAEPAVPRRPVVETTLAALLTDRAGATPDATALVFGERRVSYRELDERAAGFAADLVEHGVRPGDRVAVLLPRSVELLVALHAIHRAGAAYVPVDPALPADRIAFMIEDAMPAAVVHADEPGVEGLLGRRGGPVPVRVGERRGGAPVPGPVPGGPAYLIYTSGSTGRPKGVLVSHRSVVNRLRWMAAEYGLDHDDVHLQKTPISFDVSVWELFLPVLTGAALVVAEPDAHRDPARLVELITGHGVTTVHFVPSMLSAFVTEPTIAACTGLRWVFCSGEELRHELVARLRSRLPVPVANLYGPTEATVDVSGWTVEDEAGIDVGTVPIGHPAWNTGLHVLDPWLRPAPVGVPGELYLSGIQLALGYLGRAGLTADRFVAAPDGTRRYRTGDLARRRPDGAVEYLGRLDDQVKLRGFRIELGEIRAALTAQPGITDAAVVVREGRLVGYPVAASALDLDAVTAALARRLPGYMVPAALVVLPALPTNASGKLDRARLPAPAAAVTGDARPRTPVEATLCRLMAEVLGLPDVGVEDSFFALGGDSIVSIQLVSRARAEGIVIAPHEVFDQRSPAALARVVSLTDRPGPAEPRAAALGDVPLTPVLRWALDRAVDFHRLAQTMVVPIPADADPAALAAALAALLDTHDLLRARLNGELLTVPAAAGAPLPRGLLTERELGPDPAAALARAQEDAADQLDPAAGVLLRAVRLRAAGADSDLLLLVAHHLAVDGVSWRILLPDLRSAYESALAGDPPALEPATTSFRTWAQGLAGRAGEPDTVARLGHWESVLAGGRPLPGVPDLDPRAHTFGHLRHVEVALAPAPTRALLTEVTEVFHTGVEDLLVAGLFAAMCGQWPALADGLVVEVEGHGRGEVVELARTVGWFTTIHPVLLQAPGGVAQPDQMVKQTKEQLAAGRAIAESYGLLRWCHPRTGPLLAALPRPPVLVNYLGRFGTPGADRAGPAHRVPAYWVAGDTAGVLGGTAGRSTPARHPLSVTAVARQTPAGPALEARFSWPDGLLPDGRVEALAADWVRVMEAIVAQVSTGSVRGLTPSDLTLVDFSQDELDELEDEWGLP